MHDVSITVFHNVTEDSLGRASGFDGFEADQTFREVIQFDQPFVGRDETLEGVYFLCNHIPHEAFNEIEPGSQQVIDAYRSKQVRSLSVGDVIVMGESAYAVAKSGFDSVTLAAGSIVD